MPRKIDYYQPDQLDCNTLCTALGCDFGVQAEIETRYERDQVTTTVRCRPAGVGKEGLVQVQARVSSPLRGARSLYTMQYSALLDCWHQLDRGVLGVAQTPIVRSWDGRPRTPGRTTAK